jgi:hypothetical protein
MHKIDLAKIHNFPEASSVNLLRTVSKIPAKNSSRNIRVFPELSELDREGWGCSRKEQVK